MIIQNRKQSSKTRKRQEMCVTFPVMNFSCLAMAVIHPSIFVYPTCPRKRGQGIRAENQTCYTADYYQHKFPAVRRQASTDA